MFFSSVKVLIATIGLGLSSAAIADDLVYLSKESSGTVWYYDAETIRRNSNNTVVVWVELDHSKDKAVSYRTSKVRFKFDCAAETKGVLAAYQYRADGSISDQTTLPTDTGPVVPGTFGHTLFKKMCPK